MAAHRCGELLWSGARIMAFGRWIAAKTGSSSVTLCDQQFDFHV
jgi:hypothetical protein